MLDKNRWRACLLPDNYQRKLRQALVEQLGDNPEAPAQRSTPSFVIGLDGPCRTVRTSDVDLTSSSRQDLGKVDVAADSATHVEQEEEKHEDEQRHTG
jgi:hypothetical protein